MRMLVDIDREVADGHMSAAQASRLKKLARRQLTDLAVNSLIGFGVIAFTIGFAFVSGSVPGLMVEGATIGMAGLAVLLIWKTRFGFLGQLMLIVGLLLFGGAAVVFDTFSARSVYGVAVALFAAAVLIESGLLAALSVLVLSCAMGASAAYRHAEYTLIIDHPLETIGVFTVLAIALVVIADRVPRRENVLLIAARTAALLVNFAFLVGSLWGDQIGQTTIPAGPFAVGWALALLVAAGWAWNANRRWPLVAAIVFAALHLYTQLFEHLGPEPGTILLAGVATVAIGFALKLLFARAGSMAAGGGPEAAQA